jgi:predicted DNA-binding protein (MmcQ/YjbR family)
MPAFDDVRAICTTLPQTEEVVTWEVDVTFRVRGKIYAIGGEGSDRVSIKSTPLVQSDLIDQDPETYAKAAYVGRFGWLSVNLERVPRDVLEQLLRDAWRSVAPKAFLREVDGG